MMTNQQSFNELKKKKVVIKFQKNKTLLY
jgi:hypothetical protein